MDTQTLPAIGLADTMTRALTTPSSSLLSAAKPRIRILLSVMGGQIMRGHILDIGLDIGADRLAVSVPSVVEPEQECAVFFDLAIDDQLYVITGTGRVKACTPNEKGGFRTDMSLTVANEKSRRALEKFFGRTPRNFIQ